MEASISVGTISVGSMLQMWREFNLSAMQSELDTVAAEIAERQDESVISRKKLVTESKAFNKNTPDEAKKIVNPLIKLFQGEIDKLSKRSKAAEQAFLSCYKKILEVPDPVPALDLGDTLQRANQTQHDAETKNKKLRDTIEQYKKDFAEAKVQERELKSLRVKVEELEGDLEKESNDRASKKEKELSAKFAEKEAALQETQLLVAAKLEVVEQKAAELQQQNNMAQQELFKVRTETEETLSSKQTELDMLNNDLERLNSRTDADQQEIKDLREELEKLRARPVNQVDDNEDAGPVDATVTELRSANESLERDIREKEREMGQMVADMSHLQESLKISREHHTTDKSRFENMVHEKTKQNADLESKLHRWRDYDEIKRELTVLKSVEFPETRGVEEKEGCHKSLEVLLLEKNRTIQSDNTQLRLQQSDLGERYEQMQKNHTDMRIQIESQETLIRQLEADLLTINHTHRDVMKGLKRPAVEGAASMVGSELTNFTQVTSSTQKYHSPFVPVQSNSMSTDLISEAVKSIGGEADAGGEETKMIAQQQNSVDSSLLAIVSSQRERFRVRVQELEEQSHVQQQHMQMLQNDMDQLRSDNVKLYEKIKFLQSYNGPGKNQAMIKMGGTSIEDFASRKYAGEYEQQLDPFAKFSQRERARKYMNLSPHDKVTLSMGRIILGSKTARTIAFFYTIFVHCLLYMILYKYANQEDCRRHVGDHITLEMCEKAFGQHQAL